MSLLCKNKVQTSIIPIDQKFYRVGESKTLDYKELAVFATIGFFLGDATHYKEIKCLNPATDYTFDEQGKLISKISNFKWHYHPQDISLNQTVEEFSDLYISLCKAKLKGKKVILPLSGGIDSRSQAAALKGYKNVNTYSYKFHNSFDETSYGKKIAKINNWNFKEYVIEPGYLWGRINQLAEINQCFTDFTTPRQMGIFDEYDRMGDVFFLGHWGDVLFDDMGVADNLPLDDQVKVVVKKIIKKGGLALGGALWQEWGLLGTLEEYLHDRVYNLLKDIKIDNANSRIRAFKSMYWAPRWTSVSLNIFKQKHPLFLPYYDDEMCKFICRIPEDHLSKRQVQIEFIKKMNPELAKVPWQTYAPYNLYNYKKFHSFSNFPRRAIKKGTRSIQQMLGKPAKNIRNWEIQFTGDDNDAQLRANIFGHAKGNSFISNNLKERIINGFSDKQTRVEYAHPVSMLLTLTTFEDKFHTP